MFPSTPDQMWFAEQVETYLAGGLDAEETARFERIARDDAEAAALLATLRGDAAQLRSLFAEARPPVDLEDRLIADFRHRTLPRRMVHPMVKRAATGVAAAIVLGAIGLGVQQAERRRAVVHAPAADESRREQQDGPVTASPPDADGGYLYGMQEARESVEQKREAAGELTDVSKRMNEGNEYAGRANVQDQAQPQSGRQIEDQLELQVNAAQEKLTPYDDVFRYPDHWPQLGRDRGPLVPEVAQGSSLTSSTEATRFSGERSATADNDGGGGGGGVADGSTLVLGGQVLNEASAKGEKFQRTIPEAVANVRLDRGLEGADAVRFEPTQLAQASQARDENLGIGNQPQAGPPAEQPPVDQPVAPVPAQPAPAQPAPAQPAPAQPEASQTPPAQHVLQQRKVIRNGSLTFEVDSFDSAAMNIGKIVVEEGGFISGTDAEKLPNGKVHGTITVRVPPDRLDVLVLKLRGLGDLKGQKLNATDVTKQWTDIESELRAARAMEERLLEIIKTGKGEVKDLIAAEKELGNWRTKIEKAEGEKRYLDSQVSLSTLAITLTERDIKTPTAAFESEQVTAALETDAVDEQFVRVKEAVGQFKGRIIESDLKQYEAGQFGARVVADVPPDQTEGFVARLRQLDGRLASFNRERRQTTQGGQGAPTAAIKVEQRDTRVTVTIYNLANVAPRQTTNLAIAADDVEQVYTAILEQVEAAEGRVVTSSLARSRPEQTTGSIHLEVAAERAPALLEALRGGGEVMRLSVTENPDTQNVTTAKRGFVVNLHALATVPPRETTTMQVATADVPAAFGRLVQAVQAPEVSARVIHSQLNQQDRRSVSAAIDLEVRRADLPAVNSALAAAGAVISQNVSRSADAENTIDTKVRLQVGLVNIDRVPPRQTTVMSVEVRDVEKILGSLATVATTAGGKVADSNLAKEPDGRVTGRIVLEVPQAKSGDLIARVGDSGTVRSIQTARNEQVPDGEVARTRVEVTLSNGERLVAGDQGFMTSLRDGLGTSIRGLLWSLQLIIIGVFLIGPWALLAWGGWTLWKRRRAARDAAAT